MEPLTESSRVLSPTTASRMQTREAKVNGVDWANGHQVWQNGLRRPTQGDGSPGRHAYSNFSTKSEPPGDEPRPFPLQSPLPRSPATQDRPRRVPARRLQPHERGLPTTISTRVPQVHTEEVRRMLGHYKAMLAQAAEMRRMALAPGGPAAQRDVISYSGLFS